MNPIISATTAGMTDLAFQTCINPDCRRDRGPRRHRVPVPEVRRPARRRLRLGPAAAVPKSLRALRGASGPNRTDPLDFSGVWRFRELLPFAPDDQILTIGEGQTLCQRADAVAAYVGMKPGRLFLQYEGMNPSRQLQGQRHDGGVHPRPHGRRPPGRLRQHRQHQRQPRRLLLRHAA